MEAEPVSIVEKWRIDAEYYKTHRVDNVKLSLCETCIAHIVGDAFHCDIYRNEEKPRGIRYGKRGCKYYQDVEPLEIDNDFLLRYGRIIGGIFGFIIGDMLGVPVEFSSRDDRINDPVEELRAYGVYNQPFGSWSDDTSLMLCLIDGLSTDDLDETVRHNMIDFIDNGGFTPTGKVFDVGNSTRLAIERMKKGIPMDSCGGKGIRDNGNGALMRILPMAFIAGKLDINELSEKVCKISSYTHAHDISKVACLIYVLFASRLLEGDSIDVAYDHAISDIKRCWNKSVLPREFSRIVDKTVVRCSAEEISSTPYVVDTLEAVIWCVTNNKSYKDTVLSAVNLGGDTDTIAALSGGLAGVSYGYQELPVEWIQAVKDKKRIYQMIKKFISFNNL